MIVATILITLMLGAMIWVAVTNPSLAPAPQAADPGMPVRP